MIFWRLLQCVKEYGSILVQPSEKVTFFKALQWENAWSERVEREEGRCREERAWQWLKA